MLWRVARRELVRHPLRTALAAAGVAVATAMLVDMLMLGGGIQRSFNQLLGARGYGIRVTPAGTLPFDTDATLPGADSLRRLLASEPGVAGVAPVLGANLLAAGPRGAPRSGAGTAEGPGTRPPIADGPNAGASEAARDTLRLFVLGVDPGEQGVYRLVEGREPRSEGEAVVGRGTAAAAGISRGDTLRLTSGRTLGGGGSRSFEVVGTAEFLYASRDERPVAVPLPALQELTRRPDRVSFFMVRTGPGTSVDAAARALDRRLAGARALSAGRLVERARERLSYFRQLALILGAVSLVTTGLLVGTIMAVSVSERVGTLAALRAVGVARRHILAGLALESLLLCAVGGLAGLGLGIVTAGWLEGILSDLPGLPQAVRFFVLAPGDLARAWAAVLGVGLAAALVPAWRAAGLPVAETLHREEP